VVPSWAVDLVELFQDSIDEKKRPLAEYAVSEHRWRQNDVQQWRDIVGVRNRQHLETALLVICRRTQNKVFRSLFELMEVFDLSHDDVQTKHRPFRTFQNPGHIVDIQDLSPCGAGRR
jgi:hypothetical protein